MKVKGTIVMEADFIIEKVNGKFTITFPTILKPLSKEIMKHWDYEHFYNVGGKQ